MTDTHAQLCEILAKAWIASQPYVSPKSVPCMPNFRGGNNATTGYAILPRCSSRYHLAARDGNHHRPSSSFGTIAVTLYARSPLYSFLS